MSIQIHKVNESRIDEVDFDNLVFGHTFSDHMFQVAYRNGQWNQPEIVPFGKIEVYPSLSCLHYGQSIFEGLKAFRSVDGSINIFRLDKHIARMKNSCERMCIPTVDDELFREAVTSLVSLDRNWIPKARGSSLYIRPFIFASEDYIGVRVSEKYEFFVLTGPVSTYFKEGLSPVKLMTSEGYVRAVRGGLGEAKTAANYAASLLPAMVAQKRGFSQVLWLDALEGKYIDEVGTMNIAFIKDGALITPPLEGTILPGVTRDSVIQLAKKKGMRVEERRISIDEVMESVKEGSMTEVFGTGTAAVISPVGEIYHNGETVKINNFETGPFAKMFYDEITGIQYGEKEDTFGWITNIR
ncbi:branched-chain amino acid aminotransferase [Candidatus Methanomassiliicoccus intestinalis]|uniref:branched-chain amino acid aminotransferase n=1 Tax=Candidatus Methanomassiliicoccus intestinalis TaxID=1406512 RepID=UPI0037DD55DC